MKCCGSDSVLIVQIISHFTLPQVLVNVLSILGDRHQGIICHRSILARTCEGEQQMGEEQDTKW